MEPALNRDGRIRVYADAVAHALASVDPDDQRRFVAAVASARQIVVAGRGRSGMVASAFARRLGQMDLRAWGLDDSTVPRLGAGDVLVAATGSGTTPTVLSLMRTARSGEATVLCVTRAPDRVGDAADLTVALEVPAAAQVYPLGTLFEASCLAFFDLVTVDLLQELGATESDLGARHTNLE